MLLLFVAILGVFGSVAIAQWVKDAEEGKVSLKNISTIFFQFAFLFLPLWFLGWRSDYFKLEISIIFYMTMAGIFFITAIEAKTASSHASLDEIKDWLKWLISLLVGTYLLILYMEYPETKKEFQMLSIVIATGIITRNFKSITNAINRISIR